MINIGNIKSLLESVPPDLKIISEDKKTINTHKLLVGLMNSFLANIFLEEAFFGEKLTLFIPHESKIVEDAFSSSDIERTVSAMNELFCTTQGITTYSDIPKSAQKENESLEDDFDINYIDEYKSNEKAIPCPVRIPVKKLRAKKETQSKNCLSPILLSA